MAVSFTYDGVPVSKFGIFLSQSHRRMTAGTREKRVLVPGKAGQYDAGSEHEMRQIELDLTMIADDRRSLVENMHAFAALMDPTRGYRPLIFDDDPNRYLKMKLVGDVPTDHVMNHSTFTVGLQATDPYYYATQPTVVQWNAEGPAPSTTFVNPGTVEAPVVITIVPLVVGRVRQVAAGLGGIGALLAPLSSPTLTVAGAQVGYTGQLLPTDTLVIDTAEYSLMKNGVSHIEAWVGEMPSLPPGEVTLTERDAHGAGATVTLEFTPRSL